MRGDLGAVEPRPTQQPRDRVAEVAGRVRAVQHEARRQAIVGGHVAAHVDQVQPAAGSQYTENLRRGSGFRIAVQVVQHHRRQHPVEFAVAIGEPLRVTALEANPTQPGRLSLCPPNRQRVGIGSDYVNRWMALLGADGEIAGAAANFQDPLRPGEFGLADQLVMDAVEAEQPGQQVVAGKQRVVAGGGG